MQSTPKSLRLQIGIFGRTNVGKSSFLNMVAGQDVAITSPLPGTTTDVVEKVMELLPVGPVVFMDTGGLDDASKLGGERVGRAMKIFDRAEIILLLLEADIWTEFEERVCQEARRRKIPVIGIVNKSDRLSPSESFQKLLGEKVGRWMACSSVARAERDRTVTRLKEHLLAVCPEDFVSPPPLLGDLISSGGVVVLIVPIDKEAPKGRIILPQVQAIRDALDHHAVSVVVQHQGYAQALKKLKEPPSLVVCDSQVVDHMVANTPEGVVCTTFSILLARIKGDLDAMTRGILAVESLKDGDKVLISESCSHHAIEDDIGRIKIPKWLRNYSKKELDIQSCAGRDFPRVLGQYKLVVQCGSCMLNRRETLMRIERALAEGVAITNYGVCISYLQGVLERVLGPFPQALAAFHDEKEKIKKAG